MAGKLQYGSAWWFMDQLDGMTAQMRALSNRALLGRMVQDVAFFNARAYLGLDLGSLGRGVEPAAA